MSYVAKTLLFMVASYKYKKKTVTAKDNETKVLGKQEKKEFEEMTNDFYNNVYLNLKIK